MERAREEIVMRITAQFVAEQESGLQPHLSDFVRRYPTYADEIADFVIYYYAHEASLPACSEAITALSASSLTALNKSSIPIDTSSAQNALTLATLARRQQYSLSQLATALNLSADIVENLANQQIDTSTIPYELIQRLTQVLNQSMSTVRQTLGLVSKVSVPNVLLEQHATYYLNQPCQSFREALVASPYLSSNQCDQWCKVLTSENL